MEEDTDELQHLQVGEVRSNKDMTNMATCHCSPLPLEILLHLRFTGRQQIVKIHHVVNSGIEESCKPTILVLYQLLNF